MIDLQPSHLSMVREILDRFLSGYPVRLFGSRAHGTAGEFSDVDLVVVGEGAVPEYLLSAAREAFADSDLPYRVDLLDWHRISPEFRAVIEKQGSVPI